MSLPTSIYDGSSSTSSPSLLHHARSILHALSTLRLLSEDPSPEDFLLPTSQHSYHLANTNDFTEEEDGNSLPTDTVGESYSLSSIGLGNTADHFIPTNTSASSTRSLAYLNNPTITTAFALRSPSASNLASLAEGSGLALRNSVSMVNLAATSTGSDVSADGLAQRPNTPTNLYRPGTPTNLYRPNTPTGLHRPSTPTGSNSPAPKSRPHSLLSLSGLNVSSFSAASSPRTSPSVVVPNLDYFDLDPERIGGSSFIPSSTINTLAPDDGKTKRRLITRGRIVSLWPPPPVTGFVVIATITVSLLAAIRLLPITPTNTPAVISHAKILSLMISPFLVPLRQLTQVFLAITNFFALLLMEISVSEALGGNWKKFARLMSVLTLVIMGAKQGVGMLFTSSTGFAVPALYFSRALWEASSGLAPYLSAILPFYALPSLWPASYILRYKSLYSSSSRSIIFHKRNLLLILFLLNAFPKTILWWSLTALAIGGLATLAIHIHIFIFHDRELLLSLEPPRNRWRALLTTFFRALSLLFITSIALLLFNIIHTRQQPLSQAQLSTLNATFLILTAPRPGDVDFLTTTIESYLPYLQTTQPAPFRILVYTHFAEGQHKVFDEARIRFSRIAPRSTIEFLRDPEVSDVPLTEGKKFDHFHHLERAVKIVQHRGLRGGWLGILEDDFRLCDDGWDRLMKVLWVTKERWIGTGEIEDSKGEHEVNDGRGCGAAFVATGGNGLFAPPDLLSAIEHHLHNKTRTAPDLTVQDCLLGLLPGCEQCKGRLVVPERLVMGHMGYNASTGHRGYRREQWQCEWRHPFNNGLSDIVVV